MLSSLYSKLTQNKTGVNIYISPLQPQAFGSLSQHLGFPWSAQGSKASMVKSTEPSWAKMLGQTPGVPNFGVEWQTPAQHQSPALTSQHPTSTCGVFQHQTLDGLFDSPWDKAEIAPSPALPWIWDGRGLG